MLDWLKRKAAPVTCEANPGHGIKVSLAFTNGERTWTESVDVMDCLSDALRAGGYSHSTGKSWLEIEPGLVLQPRFVSFQLLANGGVQTLTTIEVSHPLGIPAGVFEFQHSDQRAHAPLRS